MLRKSVSADRALSRRKSTAYRMDINPEVWKDFFDRVGNGVSFESCCYGSGLAPSTVREWLKKGELLKDENLPKTHSAWQYVRFYREFHKRRSDYETIHKANINDHAVSKRPGEWTASAWSLERAKPELYCVNHRIEKVATGKLNQIFQHLFQMGDLNFREQLVKHLESFPELDSLDFGDPRLTQPEL